MWIAPAAALGQRFLVLCSWPRGLPTVTGDQRNTGSLSSPRSNARRHLNTWFAFTPWGLRHLGRWRQVSVNCAIWSFSEIDRKREHDDPYSNPTPSDMGDLRLCNTALATRDSAYAYVHAERPKVSSPPKNFLNQ